jgi:DNA-binding Xre family transcriptional regulator
MGINYQGLFNILNDREITLSALCDDLRISSATRAKLSKGDYVSLRTLESIATYLNGSIGDIMTFLRTHNPSPLLARLQEEMTHAIKGGIYHETQILMTYNSNHIEGSRLSIDQTRYIFETNTIGLNKDTSIRVDDIIETHNHFRCVDYILTHALEPLTEVMIKDLHRILKSSTSDASLSWFRVGDYKQRPNVVGGQPTSAPKDVHHHMSSLIGTYEASPVIDFKRILDFHVQFETIHPFQDGNGRVGRLIAFKECLRHGHIPFTIDETIKLFYYRGLKEWKTEPGYLLDTCRTGQDQYNLLLNKFEIE